MKRKLLRKLVDLYRGGGGINITQYFTDNHNKQTEPEDLMISYDIRAGIDVEDYKRNPTMRDSVVERIASIIKKYSDGIIDGSILECCSGEGLNLTLLNESRQFKFSWWGGFDISWSRVKIAQKFSEERGCKNMHFFCADANFIPLNSSSIDVVFTMQSIAENGGNEEHLIRELYRVCKRLLIIIEPSYENSGKEAKNRMESLGYIKGLRQTIEKLGLNLVEEFPFQVDINKLNPAWVTVIEKAVVENADIDDEVEYVCPITNMPLRQCGDSLFARESLLGYPTVNGIPMLMQEYAVVATKMEVL